MIGELDYAGLFYGEETETESVFSGFVMLALAVFVVFIVLLLVNFLIGLAAEEIRVCSTQYFLTTNRITDCCDFVVTLNSRTFMNEPRSGSYARNWSKSLCSNHFWMRA